MNLSTSPFSVILDISEFREVLRTKGWVQTTSGEEADTFGFCRYPWGDLHDNTYSVDSITQSEVAI